INYVASNAKYTVYIIDEVHMLSTSAFNALLKTLEEPPENVIFILATTEAHKVPQTILSRCQRFDFRRIRNEDIIIRMKEIAAADGYNITDDAYRMLAQLADGSLRDGLSVMERVISASGNTVSAEDIVNTLGISTQDSVFELTDAIINGDSAAVIACIDKTLAEGKDLTQLGNTMLSHFRALMICKLSDKPENLLDYDPQSLVRLKAQSGRMTFEKIDHASTLISEAISDARLAKSARIIYELAFIKLTRPELDRTPQGIMDKLTQLEQKMELGAAIPQQNVIPQSAGADNSEILNRLSAIEKALQNGAAAEPIEQPKPQPEKKKVSHRLYNPIPKDELNFDYPTAKLARNWRSTVETMKQKGAAYVMPLTNCTVTFDADSLIIVVPEGRQGFTFKMAVSHIDAIRENFRKVTGSPYNIKIVNRADLDDEQIINPFDLPHIEGAAEKYKKEETVQQTQGNEKTDSDRFDEFIAKFAGIITDGDRIMPGDDAKLDTGVQSSLDDIEDESNDREEFLDVNELSSDDEEDN
ncbi:MAG: DNA polymerase III subunit delta, partial [Candidatus Ornithomonoglobus sp.]